MKIYFLRFPKEASDQPVIYRLVKQYDVEFNILKADILTQREGYLILELKGKRENIKEALAYIRSLGIQAERLSGKVSRDDGRCFQCGACTGICPVGALHIVRPEMSVAFDPELCTGCGLCVNVCPVKAMEVSLEQLDEVV